MNNLIKAADELAEAYEHALKICEGRRGKYAKTDVQEALTAYRTARNEQGEVKVKPLVWVEDENGYWSAGEYSIQQMRMTGVALQLCIFGAEIGYSEAKNGVSVLKKEGARTQSAVCPQRTGGINLHGESLFLLTGHKSYAITVTTKRKTYWRDKMESLAALAISEMPEAVKAAFLTADNETRVNLALAYAQDAADKQQKITNTLRSYPHKMEEFKAVVYDRVAQ